MEKPGEEHGGTWIFEALNKTSVMMTVVVDIICSTKDNIKIKVVFQKCISIMCKETRDNKKKQFLSG